MVITLIELVVVAIIGIIEVLLQLAIHQSAKKMSSLVMILLNYIKRNLKN